MALSVWPLSYRIFSEKADKTSSAVVLPVVYGEARVKAIPIWVGQRSTAPRVAVNGGGDGNFPNGMVNDDDKASNVNKLNVGGRDNKNPNNDKWLTEYYFPVVFALCEGEILGLGDWFWCNQPNQTLNNVIVGRTNPTYTVGTSSAKRDYHYVGWNNGWQYREPNYPIPRFGFTVVNGTMEQGPCSVVKDIRWSNGQHDADWGGDNFYSWPGVAYMAHPSFWCGTSEKLLDIEVLVRGVGATESMWWAASPADVLVDQITHPRRGAGQPDTIIDSTSLSVYRSYCLAAGLGIKWVCDRTQPVLDNVKLLMEATNSELYWSDGRYKIAVLADTPVYDVQGAEQWTPPNWNANVGRSDPVYALDEDDFVANPGEDPVRVEQRADADIYNSFPVKVIIPEYDYSAQEIITDDDTVDVNRFGLKRAPVTDFPCLSGTGMNGAAAAAQMMSRILARRATRVLNTYSFKLPWQYSRLDRGDVVSLTDSVAGLDNVAVRIIEIDEGDDGLLSMRAVDWPAGCSTAPLFGAQTGESGTYERPTGTEGTVADFVWMPPTQATAYRREVWIAAAGNGTAWYGAEVWASWDATNYSLVGEIRPAIIGSLTADLPSGPPPDETNTLSVDLGISHGGLNTATEKDRDGLVTLCYVGEARPVGSGGELLSYATATATGSYTYDVSSLRRGCLGTVPEDHGNGDRFLFIDSRVLRLAVPESRLGGTLSVRIRGFDENHHAFRDLDDIIPVSYALPARKGAVLPLPVTLPFDDWNQDEWTVWGVDGTTKFTVEETGLQGGRALRITGPAWLRYERNIPYDAGVVGGYSEILALKIRLRQYANPDSPGTKAIYGGLVQVDKDGATFRDLAGQSITETSTNIAAYLWLDNMDGISINAGQDDNAWQEYTGYWQSTAATGTLGGASMVPDGEGVGGPGKAQTLTRYIRPVIAVNQTGNGVVDIDCVSLWVAIAATDIVARQNAEDAFDMANGKNKIYYTYGEPTPPAGGFVDGDLWFDQRPNADGGHAMPFVWNASLNGGAGGWEDAKGQARIVGLDIAGETITGNNIQGNTIEARHLKSGPGNNLLYNADFSSVRTGVTSPAPTHSEFSGWTFINDFWGTNCKPDVNFNTTWSLGRTQDSRNTQSLNTMYITQGGVANAGEYAELRSNKIPVVVGTRYCASAYTGAHRCQIMVDVIWYDVDGNELRDGGGDPIHTISAGGTGNDAFNEDGVGDYKNGGSALAQYKRCRRVDIAPTNATAVAVRLLKFNTHGGQADSYLFACRAALEEMPPGGLEPGPWFPAPKTIMDENGIASNAFRTTDYESAYDGGIEYAGKGAKMQNAPGLTDASLMVAATHFKIGKYTAEDLFLESVKIFGGRIICDHGAIACEGFPAGFGVSAEEVQVVQNGSWGMRLNITRSTVQEVSDFYHVISTPRWMGTGDQKYELSRMGYDDWRPKFSGDSLTAYLYFVLSRYDNGYIVGPTNAGLWCGWDLLFINTGKYMSTGAYG